MKCTAGKAKQKAKPVRRETPLKRAMTLDGNVSRINTEDTEKTEVAENWESIITPRDAL